MVISEWSDYEWILLSPLNCSVFQQIAKYYKKESQMDFTLWIISSDVHGPAGIVESMQNRIKSTLRPIYI